ncbi:MAG: Fe(2+)-trafficking protein [Phycisphaerales bacterium]|nr:MAG: Fe(2+)-trafficking protein [Phycisphaerales bacterium]
MDVNDRIRQFETMVRPEADPTNDMAWFSLGQAYAQAGRHRDAANAFTRCTALNPAMSKAYQLAGQALVEVGDTEKAAEVLTAGYVSAGERGDRLPQKAMGELLAAIGATVPEVKAKGPAAGASGGTFVCGRTGKPGHQMARPPFKGPVGEWIKDHISQETFNAWISQGTKVINELRLDLSREEDSDTYDKHMREYLGIDDELYESLMRVKGV